ncbi:MAG: 50S ribosomal protein L29 [Deltaproteobacteria bacterium]|nr:50S ribosomal protein L29 [Deltaproteobacteria bacterium]MBW2309331.1 50S ribosomal protein L29 [Deltaproteobacteria bacterium]
MNAKELRELSLEELLQKEKDHRGELFNLRFQHQTRQLDNNMRMKAVRKDIARVLTVLRERRS